MLMKGKQETEANMCKINHIPTYIKFITLYIIEITMAVKGGDGCRGKNLKIEVAGENTGYNTLKTIFWGITFKKLCFSCYVLCSLKEKITLTGGMIKMHKIKP